MTYRSPGIFGVPGHIDPTSRYGNGFSPGWRAEACRFGHGDRSRSGSCKESVNRCLDTYVSMHYKSADLAVDHRLLDPARPYFTLPSVLSREDKYSANYSSNSSRCISMSVVMGNTFTRIMRERIIWQTFECLHAILSRRAKYSFLWASVFRTCTFIRREQVSLRLEQVIRIPRLSGAIFSTRFVVSTEWKSEKWARK